MMTKHTKHPSPTWRKLGLMVAFLLIIMASSAVQALAGENFGVGADVSSSVVYAHRNKGAGNFSLIADVGMTFSTAPENENKKPPREFGLGAEVEVEVERAEEPPITMDNNPEEFGVGAEVEIDVERSGSQPAAAPWIICVILISIPIVALLMRKYKKRRVTATICAQKGGEMLG
ncbi:MAG: hypothetical protein HWN68_10830 [Desulfobacterales bacterium]|nr:hypothetical protein [Desulfobacterales bacterium]